MPSLPPVAGVVRCDVLYQLGSDIDALNRLYIGYSGTPPIDATCTALAADLYVIFAAELCPYMTPGNKLTGIRVTDLSSPTGGQGEHIATTNGSYSSGDVPAGVALLANAHIQRRYRGGKPRTYLPLGGSVGLTTQSLWDPTFLANVQASLDAIRVDIAVTTEGACNLSTLVNVSYYEGFVSAENPVTHRWRTIPVVRVGGPVVDVVTSWVANQKPSSQRRRNLHSA